MAPRNPVPPPPPPRGTTHGPSGRPVGRPKGSKNRAIADIRALAQSYGPDAIDRLNEIMHDTRAPHATQVAAARELLDRGFGRPTQYIANDPDNPLVDMRQKVDWDKMPKEVLQAAHAALVGGGAGLLSTPESVEDDDGE